MSLFKLLTTIEKRGAVDFKLTGHKIERPAAVRRGEAADAIDVSHETFGLQNEQRGAEARQSRIFGKLHWAESIERISAHHIGVACLGCFFFLLLWWTPPPVLYWIRLIQNTSGMRHYTKEKVIGPAKPIYYLKKSFQMEKGMVYQVVWRLNFWDRVFQKQWVVKAHTGGVESFWITALLILFVFGCAPLHVSQYISMMDVPKRFVSVRRSVVFVFPFVAAACYGACDCGCWPVRRWSQTHGEALGICCFELHSDTDAKWAEAAFRLGGLQDPAGWTNGCLQTEFFPPEIHDDDQACWLWGCQALSCLKCLWTTMVQFVWSFMSQVRGVARPLRDPLAKQLFPEETPAKQDYVFFDKEADPELFQDSQDPYAYLSEPCEVPLKGSHMHSPTDSPIKEYKVTSKFVLDPMKYKEILKQRRQRWNGVCGVSIGFECYSPVLDTQMSVGSTLCCPLDAVLNSFIH